MGDPGQAVNVLKCLLVDVYSQDASGYGMCENLSPALSSTA